MKLQIKLCGITTDAGIDAANANAVDAVGFVLSESLRRVSADRARRLAEGLVQSIVTVAVFRHPQLVDVARMLDEFRPRIVQAEYADELADLLDGRCRLLPVLHDGPGILADGAAPHCAGGVLLEAEGRGGRGVAPDWSRAAQLATRVPLILAGGLDPENIGHAIELVQPRGVDVSSGVESSPGTKDSARIAAFCRSARTHAFRTHVTAEVFT